MYQVIVTYDNPHYTMHLDTLVYEEADRLGGTCTGSGQDFEAQERELFYEFSDQDSACTFAESIPSEAKHQLRDMDPDPYPFYSDDPAVLHQWAGRARMRGDKVGAHLADVRALKLKGKEVG